MALSTLTTPGVYIQEISTLPPSIAPVSTAIPAFIGYTEKGPKNKAIRITSMLDFESAFGGAYKEIYEIDIDSASVPTISNTTSISPYTLYYHLQMYFGNGGGPCHIISVGKYDHTPIPAITVADFYVSGNPAIGISVAEEVDEVTLLVAPEVSELTSSSDIRAVFDAMLAQCDKLKDRFCIFDVQSTGVPSADSNLFRNSQVSANALKYGSAYYPPLDTILKRRYSADDVVIASDAHSLLIDYSVEPNNRLSTILGGIGDYAAIQVTGTPTAGTDTVSIQAFTTTITFTAGDDFVVGPLDSDVAASIISAINSHPVLSLVARAQIDSGDPTNLFIITRTGTATNSDLVVTTTSGWVTDDTPSTTPGAVNSQDISIYTAITNLIGAKILTLFPSATMAGIYSAVDNDRGVWKAPANVSVANIIGPSFQITEAQQGGLNIDATSGKSINAIRAFIGRGTLVWGSRTLDGNSNEWRYVPVRRLFIFVEESTKKACEFVVFEPNDKNTWIRVKGTITNFLTDLWRQGALAGSKAEEAFFVQVGLGETMTAQDILEGKLIVTIGMAAVRPAEFIVLQFMHKLQEA
jgi:phage tail sheath protein FI